MPSGRSDEDVRARILAATAELYGEKGYAETTIADVVARTRMSRRTIYEHFRSIEDLHFALYEWALGETLFKIGSLDVGPVRTDRMRNVLGILFDAIAARPGLTRAALYEFRLPEKRNVALRQRVLGFFAGALLHGVEEGYQDGVCPRKPDELTVYGVIGAIEGIIVHVIESDASPDWGAALEASLRIFHSTYPFMPERAGMGPAAG